jgi:hypothetical protein
VRLVLAFVAGLSMFLGFLVGPPGFTLYWSPTWYVVYAACAGLVMAITVART